MSLLSTSCPNISYTAWTETIKRKLARQLEADVARHQLEVSLAVSLAIMSSFTRHDRYLMEFLLMRWEGHQGGSSLRSGVCFTVLNEGAIEAAGGAGGSGPPGTRHLTSSEDAYDVTLRRMANALGLSVSQLTGSTGPQK